MDTMPGSRIRPRKLVYISKEFQLRFILRFCSLALLGAVVSSLLMYFLSRQTLDAAGSDIRLSLAVMSDAILPAVVYSNLITLALIAVAVAVVALHSSHRIAGPLFRIEEDLKVVSRGDLGKRIHLRSTDQLGALAESINTMLDAMHDNVTAIGQQVDQAILELDSLRDRDDACPVDETRKRLERIRSELTDRFLL